MAWVLAVSGCSLMFRGADHQGGTPDDAGANDGGRDSGAVDAMRPMDLDVLIARDERAVWNLTTGVLVHGGGVPDETIAPQNESQDDGAPDLAVFTLDSFVMQTGSKLRFEIGDDGNRAVVLSVRGDVIIDGQIDVSARGEVGGPGGASSDTDDDQSNAWPLTGRPGLIAQMNQVVFALSGGGGGSNGHEGGAGGNATSSEEFSMWVVTRAGGAAGMTSASVLDWQAALIGGGAGGPARCGSVWEVRGGGGGGALRIESAKAIEIQPQGVIVASGAGGESRGAAGALGRCSGAGASAGGAGGGAGGTIVLEAPTVVVEGGLFANGGGGAGGDVGASGPESGADGKASTSAAAGTSGHALGGGKYVSNDGGAGGARSTPAGSDGKAAVAASTGLVTVYPAATSAGGGGGGGVGRILIRTADGSLAAGGKFSPVEVVTELPK